MENNKGILLESGTNELEIVEFKIGDNHFGINVAKVREIIPYLEVTNIPNSHPCIKGIFKIRDSVISAVNLPKYLNLPVLNTKNSFFIIAHFNKISVGFEVHEVVGIHRISWENIDKPDATIFGGQEGIATGIVKFDNRLVIILDFEKILTDISPRTGIQMSDIQKLGPRERSQRPILIAEDSELLMKLLKDALVGAGYENLTILPNGRDAWELLQKYKEDKTSRIEDRVSCVITDIEMPQMDGHRLTKLIKTDSELSKLPVIIFSSLISDAMKIKGESLGADAQITKPEIGTLVGVVDKLIIKK